MVTLEIRERVPGTMTWRKAAQMRVRDGTWTVEGDAIDLEMPVMTAAGQLWLESDPEAWARHYPNHLRSGYLYGVVIEDGDEA